MTGYPRIDRISIILEEGYTLDRVILPADAKYLSKLDSLIAICRKQQIIVSIVKAKDFSNLSIENPQEAILLSSGFPKVLPYEFFSKFRCAVNFHPTLLPSNRGKYLH